MKLTIMPKRVSCWDGQKGKLRYTTVWILENKNNTLTLNLQNFQYLLYVELEYRW